MDHNETLDALDEYLGGSLGPEERAAVEEHLKRCSSCSAELAELRNTIEHVRTLRRVPSLPWMTQKVMARVRDEAGKKNAPSRAWFFRGISFPTGALAVVALAVTVFLVSRSMRLADCPPELALHQAEAPAPAPAHKGSSVRAGTVSPPERSSSAPSAPEVPSAGEDEALRREAVALSGTGEETTRKILLVRIRARRKGALARIEEAVSTAGATVVSKDLSSDGWVMTLKIDQLKHTALIDALRRVGKPQERTLAIDGREGLEILMLNKPKAAVGC